MMICFMVLWYMSGTVIFLKATIVASTSTLDEPKPCDLDNTKPDCKILLSFTRVDPSNNDSLSYGYNFRYTNPWSLGEEGARSLTKVYGTRIVFQVVGDGAQFDIMTLTVCFVCRSCVRSSLVDCNSFLCLYTCVCMRGIQLSLGSGRRFSWWRRPEGEEEEEEKAV